MRHAVPFTFRALYVAGFFTFISIPYAANANDFSRYHTYDELTGMLKRMAESGKNIVRMQSIGTTLEKRELWMLDIANPKGVHIDERPGIFIAANFEGDHLIGSEIALCIADYFVKKYESDPAVREIIDNHVIYVMPRINPDSAERMFAPV